MPYTPKHKGFMPKGYEVNNKLMDEMKKKRATIASSVQFRNGVLEPQGLITRTNLIDYKVPKNWLDEMLMLNQECKSCKRKRDNF